MIIERGRRIAAAGFHGHAHRAEISVGAQHRDGRGAAEFAHGVSRGAEHELAGRIVVHNRHRGVRQAEGGRAARAEELHRHGLVAFGQQIINRVNDDEGVGLAVEEGDEAVRGHEVHVRRGRAGQRLIADRDSAAVAVRADHFEHDASRFLAARVGGGAEADHTRAKVILHNRQRGVRQPERRAHRQREPQRHRLVELVERVIQHRDIKGARADAGQERERPGAGRKVESCRGRAVRVRGEIYRGRVEQPAGARDRDARDHAVLGRLEAGRGEADRALVFQNCDHRVARSANRRPAGRSRK